MAGSSSSSGWQHLAAAAADTAKGLTHTLGKAMVATGKEVRQLVAPAAEPAIAAAAAVANGRAGGEPLALLDGFGFSLQVSPEQAATLEAAAAKQQQQRLKWLQHCGGQEGQQQGVTTLPLPPPDALKRLCRRGVPPDLRHQVWLELSGAAQRRRRHPPHYYASAALQGADSPYAHQIELDVPRTFPNNDWVQSEAGQNAVRHVLLAFAHHNPHVGYCQSMNYLAAMLLLALGRDEEDAFWVLASLIDDNDDDGILYRDMYARDLSGAHVEMRCLRELVQHKLPRLAAHMDALGCDMSIVATDWFLCLFCTSLPSETAARVWDALLHEGTKVVFRVALALLKLHEGELLAQDNPGELLRAARRAVAQTYDRDLLMKIAFEGVGSMPMDTIRRYRARKQREVDREMATRETRANLRQAVTGGGFVVQESEAQLLAATAAADGEGDGRQGGSASAAAAEAAEEPFARGGSSASNGSSGSGRWVSQLQALGSSIGERAKDTIDRGRIRITHHKRGLSLGGGGGAAAGGV